MRLDNKAKPDSGCSRLTPKHANNKNKNKNPLQPPQPPRDSVNQSEDAINLPSAAWTALQHNDLLE